MVGATKGAKMSERAYMCLLCFFVANLLLRPIDEDRDVATHVGLA